ncbi:MAG: alkaline phosphatase family protein [Planctomycetes bacterium]|nr:alkaline phosphatase family protein [Planctomycetota bacterium]
MSLRLLARAATGWRSWLSPVVASTALLSCSILLIEPVLWPHLEPSYPDLPDLDYLPMRGQAHAAMPLVDPETGEFTSPGRIWIKGSESVRSASVDGGASIALDPPFYVAIAEVEPGHHEVEFGAEGVPRRAVVVPGGAELTQERDRFSLLSYGCFDPFDIQAGRVIVEPGDGTSLPGAKREPYARLWAIRALLRDAAAGELRDLPKPSLILGAGDQIYVEPAHDRYGALGLEHPLSAWTIEAKPRPRLSLGGFVKFVDATYRAGWSFSTLDAAFRQCPSVMMWDDHEIRDGWGSQGDEHVYADTYYAAAREAFLQHQFQRGPRQRTPDMDRVDAPLYQTFRLHGLPIFVLDERSARDIGVPQVLGDEQRRAFAQWLASLDPEDSPYYVVVSPLPMLYRIGDIVGIASYFEEEIRDDLHDNWGFKPNTYELNRLMLLMVHAAERGLKAVIVSGDMHMSAILRAKTRRTSEAASRVFAYEIITSGLASKVDSGGWKYEIGREGSLTGTGIELGEHHLEFELGLAEPNPNFGALEFSGDQVTVHLIQALSEGIVHYRIPLRFGTGTPAFGEMLARARQSLAIPAELPPPLAK